MPGDRLAAPDVLRGLAIAGTFATNVWVFADPRGPGAVFAGFSAGWWLDTALRAVANGKFLALLTLLFGIGMELQYRSAVRRGLRWPGRYLARAAILFTEGLLHYVLVFEFDVLMGYAIASVLVAWLVGRSARVRTAAACVAGAVTVLLVAGASVATAGSTGADVPLPPYPATWTGQVAARLTDPLLYRVELVLIVPSAVALFLAGSALLRAGLFDAAAVTLRRRLIGTGAVGWCSPCSPRSAAARGSSSSATWWHRWSRWGCSAWSRRSWRGCVPGRPGAARAHRARPDRDDLLRRPERRGRSPVRRLGARPGRGARRRAGPAADRGGRRGVGPRRRRVAAAAGWWLRGHDRGPLEALTHALLRACLEILVG